MLRRNGHHFIAKDLALRTEVATIPWETFLKPQYNNIGRYSFMGFLRRYSAGLTSLCVVRTFRFTSQSLSSLAVITDRVHRTGWPSFVSTK